MKFMKLSDHATMPTSGSKEAAGYDLYSTEDVCIWPLTTEVIHTGIAIELPPGTFGGIFSRSGLSTKQGLAVINGVGVVDSDYRGEIMVPLHNHSEGRKWIRRGDRVAQLIIIPYLKPVLVESDTLSKTDRGIGGFGSTGK